MNLTAMVKRIDKQDKTWEDGRGWGMNPLEMIGLSTAAIGDIHIVSLKPGAVRGNHYHTNATEWVLLFGGQLKIAWRSDREDSIHEISVSETEPAMFEIPRNVAHAIKNISAHDTYLIAFSDSYARETVRCDPLL